MKGLRGELEKYLNNSDLIADAEERVKKFRENPPKIIEREITPEDALKYRIKYMPLFINPN